MTETAATTAPGGPFQRIRVGGTSFERGEAYGRQARPRVLRNLEIYAGMFRYFAGLDWDDVRVAAMRFAAGIEDYEPRYLEELKGLASGAGVELADILAINVRTEIMYSARVPGGSESPRFRAECTAVAVLPGATRTGHTLLGQNWDWCPLAADTVVVLEARQDDGPDYVTVVEAGLLAKTGFNSSGLGVVTNAMVTNRDLGDTGVPYHVLLRAILDCERVSDGLAALVRSTRASSANYLIAHRDGVALDVEAMPGDYGNVFVLEPELDTLEHTNHFLSPRFRESDVMLSLSPDSPIRLQRVRSELRRAAPAVAVDDLQRAFSDHANQPRGVCAHGDTDAPIYEQASTVASVIMDLDAGCMWLAEGKPCTTPYRQLSSDELFSTPDGVVEPPRSPRPVNAPG